MNRIAASLSVAVSSSISPTLQLASSQDDDENYQEDLQPPENFSLVCAGVYRSAFPKKKNFGFLAGVVKVRTVLYVAHVNMETTWRNGFRTLILEEYPDVNRRFLEENNIQFFQFGVPGNKEPFVDIPEDKIAAALSVLMDRRNHPVLIHCNKGKHRTGCLVGCLRKLQHWSYTSIFDEYRLFSHPKSRAMDQQFIELFDTRQVKIDERWLPDWPELRDSW